MEWGTVLSRPLEPEVQIHPNRSAGEFQPRLPRLIPAVVWPIITSVMLVALIVLQAHWRRRFARAEQAWRAEADNIRKEEQEQVLQIQSQQEAV